MFDTIVKNLQQYKKIFVSLTIFELMRGFFIVLAAWLMMKIVSTQFMNDSAFKIMLILLVVLSCKVLIENFRLKKFNELSLQYQKSLRQKLHQSFFTSPNTLNSGKILTLIFDTVESFDEFFVKVLPNILTIIILIPLILIVTLLMDSLTALIFFVTLPIAPFLIYLIGQAVSSKNQAAMLALTKLNGDFRELLSAITTLKIFRQSEAAFSKLKSTSEQSAAATLEVLKLAFVSAFALELITTLSIALIAVTVGLRLVDAAINFDAALFLLILAPEFYLPIRQLGSVFHAAIKAKDSLNSIKNFQPQFFSTFNDKFDREILIRNEKLIKLNAVNIVIGESGSGKSTFLKYLADIYKDAAYMPQQPHLFKATIRDNLTLFKSFDDSILKKILDAVGLNLNLDSKVTALSRGQLQRLGLARALLKDAEILILDEPTAALDVETEEKILQLINDYKKNRTVVIATHRPAVIALADETINFDIDTPHD